jgi:hypothetical protein
MRPETAPLDLPAAHASRLRQDPRALIALAGQIRIGSGPWRVASIVDISRSGFRIAWLPNASIGKHIWVRLPKFEAMPAVIRWRDHAGVGCQFTRPLHPTTVEHLQRVAPPLAV